MFQSNDRKRIYASVPESIFTKMKEMLLEKGVVDANGAPDIARGFEGLVTAYAYGWINIPDECLPEPSLLLSKERPEWNRP